VRRAKQGQDLLNELNNTLTSAAWAFSDPIINPEQMPLMPPQAMHNAPYVITDRTAIGVIPVSSGQKRMKGERGPDVEVCNRRTCARCKEFGGNDWELLNSLSAMDGHDRPLKTSFVVLWFLAEFLPFMEFDSLLNTQ
jgi:hypothetical protein